MEVEEEEGAASGLQARSSGLSDEDGAVEEEVDTEVDKEDEEEVEDAEGS